VPESADLDAVLRSVGTSLGAAEWRFVTQQQVAELAGYDVSGSGDNGQSDGELDHHREPPVWAARTALRKAARAEPGFRPE
jgi:hypothetical protein